MSANHEDGTNLSLKLGNERLKLADVTSVEGEQQRLDPTMLSTFESIQHRVLKLQLMNGRRDQLTSLWLGGECEQRTSSPKL